MKKRLAAAAGFVVKASFVIALLFLASMVMQTRSQLDLAEEQIEDLRILLDDDVSMQAEPGQETEGGQVAGATDIRQAFDIEDVASYLFKYYEDDLKGEKGPKGDKGDPGEPGADATGVATQTIYASNSGSNKVEAKASCPSGLKPLGGGCRGNNTATSRVVITQSYPQANYWFCAATHLDGGTFELNAAVICGN